MAVVHQGESYFLVEVWGKTGFPSINATPTRPIPTRRPIPSSRNNRGKVVKQQEMIKGCIQNPPGEAVFRSPPGGIFFERSKFFEPPGLSEVMTLLLHTWVDSGHTSAKRNRRSSPGNDPGKKGGG